jgi:hypothetical protein
MDEAVLRQGRPIAAIRDRTAPHGSNLKSCHSMPGAAFSWISKQQCGTKREFAAAYTKVRSQGIIERPTK